MGKKGLKNIGKNRRIKIVIVKIRIKVILKIGKYSPSVELISYLYFGSSFAILQQVQPLSQACSEHLALPHFWSKQFGPCKKLIENPCFRYTFVGKIICQCDSVTHTYRTKATS